MDNAWSDTHRFDEYPTSLPVTSRSTPMAVHGNLSADFGGAWSVNLRTGAAPETLGSSNTVELTLLQLTR